MPKKGLEMLVGLFVLIGMIGLVFLAVQAANLGAGGGGPSYRVQARFDNVGGLKPRAPVRSAGVTVGRVTSIHFDPKTFQGVVAMEIENAYAFPRDSSAKILTAGLLGDQYVGIEPGGDEKNFVAGDVITQTQSAVVLESLISQFLFNKAADSGTSAGSAGGKP